MSPRVGRVAAHFTSPGDVLLAARVLGWALVLPALKHLVPVKSLAAVMHQRPATTHRNLAREQRIVTFARWGARLVRWKSGGNCLERGLLAYRYLCAAGAEPVLVVGLGQSENGMLGHAWVLVDGRPAGESQSAVDVYTPVFAFAPDGSMLGEIPVAGSAKELHG